MKFRLLALFIFVSGGSVANAFFSDGFGIHGLAPRLSFDDVDIPLNYSFSVSAGWDSNIDSRSSSNADSSPYVRPSLTATYADFSNARSSSSFSLRLGTVYYYDVSDKSSTQTNTQSWRSDSALSWNYSYRVNSRLSFTSGFSAAYQMEPDFFGGVSLPNSQGNYLTLSESLSMSYRWSTRFTTSSNLSYSMIRYDEIPDENYTTWSAGESCSYSLTELTSWNLGYSFSGTTRNEGLDSISHSGNTGLSTRLTEMTSLNFSIGAQFKKTSGTNNGSSTFNPNLTYTLGLNSRLTENLTWNISSTYENEDIGTYSSRGNYSSNQTLRVNLGMSYAINSRSSCNFGFNDVFSSYTKGSPSLSDSTEQTISVNLGYSYRISNYWSMSANASFTSSPGGGVYNSQGYTRYNVSMSTTYSF